MRNRTRKPTIIVASLLSVGAMLVGSRLHAESKTAAPSGNELEESRREVRRLREQVQSLRSTLSDAAELDRQRLALINKALKNGPTNTEAKERSDEGRASRTTAAATVATTSAPPAAPSLPSLPKRRVEATTGIVRGKLDLPRGEPVAYVYVENVYSPAVRSEKVRIEQVRKQFVPSWAVIQRGTTVEFPNTDSVYHNVFSQSSGNSFDLGLYNSTAAAKNHTFDEAGSVDIFCNIHPQMAASILVVPNRHFAKVKPDGSFEIEDVPAGKRKVVAWAPGSRLHVQWVDLTGGETADVAFRLEQKLPGHKNKDGQQYGSYQ